MTTVDRSADQLNTETGLAAVNASDSVAPVRDPLHVEGTAMDIKLPFWVLRRLVRRNPWLLSGGKLLRSEFLDDHPLTFALIVIPSVWDWRLEWRRAKRGAGRSTWSTRAPSLDDWGRPSRSLSAP